MERNWQKNIIIVAVAFILMIFWLAISDNGLGIFGNIRERRVIEKEEWERKIRETDGKFETGPVWVEEEGVVKETKIVLEEKTTPKEEIIKEEEEIIIKKEEEIIFKVECGVIASSDFNEDTCTRTRRENIGTLGFFPLGGNTNLATAYQLGASYHRMIIQWHKAYDEKGNFNYGALDKIFEDAERNNLKIIVSLRSNHPEKSSVTFIPGERTINDPDSLPKNEQEWKNYVREFVNRYKHRGLVAVAPLNEIWQFKTNLPHNPPNY